MYQPKEHHSLSLLWEIIKKAYICVLCRMFKCKVMQPKANTLQIWRVLWILLSIFAIILIIAINISFDEF